jgi:hypothetical protein
MNIAWTLTAAIVIFAEKRYSLWVEPMCSSPYSPKCMEDEFSEGPGLEGRYQRIGHDVSYV